jgi:O-antigen/teichoic acid export membrane protein
MFSNDTRPQRSLGGHMLHGSFWTVAMRWSIRLLGLGNTVILARLLTPADFGIVSMAMIFIGLLEILNQTGQKQALVRLPEITREHYDTAWTLSVMMGLAIGLLIFILAPLSSFYFHDPRTIPVMQCLALRAALGGFENVGPVAFRRDLQFDRVFLYGIYPKIASIVITVILAWIMRNYWALVIGILTTQVALIITSYSIHPFRPRFSLSKLDDIWSFSIWTLVRSIGFQLNMNVEVFVIGGVTGATQMGRFTVADDLASSPSSELNAPMVSVLLPVMSTVQNDPGKLRNLYLRVLSWSAAICSATSVGTAMVSADLVSVVLGPKWIDTIPLMPWLALAAGLFALVSGAYATFDTLGIPSRGARLQWTRLLYLVTAIVPIAIITRNIVFIAAARLIITAIFIPTVFLVVGRTINVSAKDYVSVLWRPFGAAAIMAGAIYCININLPFTGAPRLIVDVAAGMTVYPLSMLLLWYVAGRPDSAESDAIAALRLRFQTT